MGSWRANSPSWPGIVKSMRQLEAGYEYIKDFPKLPAGGSFGQVTAVATDSQDRLYVFQRATTPVTVFDRDGNYLSCWGIDAITDPHGMTIVDDIVYTTDRKDSVAVIFTLDGKPLQVIGKRGVHSDTGCEKPGDLVPRAAGPFNYPTEMAPGPSGDLYISDGYRNCRVHRFTRDGQLINSWGEPGKTAPGHFHLSHSVLVAPDGKVYVGDRANRRVQIFSPEGEFISMWTGMSGPNHVARDKDGLFYICEQKADGAPGFVSIRDGAGTVLARWESRQAHGLWVDSHGDIYLGSTSNRSVDKYVRKG
jgi:DNA-binding beta-propeller fold protein YncE